jgi:YGGT family
MADLIKETVMTNQTSQTDPNKSTVIKPIKVEASKSQTIEYLVYFFFGLLEVLLTLRLVFKLAGASLASPFIGFIYGATRIFVAPFEGIFRKGFTQGVETTSVFEPSTLIAIIIYALLSYGVVRLIRVLSGERQVE